MPESVRAELVSLYRAAGYAIEAAGAPLHIDAVRRREGEGERRIRITLPLESEPRTEPAVVLSDITRWKSRYPQGTYIVAMPALTSLGAPFQTSVRKAGALIRHHAGVLDVSFGGSEDIGFGEPPDDKIREKLFDYSRVDADLLQAVVRTQYTARALEQAPTRVQQRYFIRDGAGTSPADRRPVAGADLLHHLVARLGQPPSGPEVFVIIGAGGGGKTWLFEGLYTYLFEAFQNQKSRMRPSVRPLAVLPDDLLRAGVRSARNLLEATQRTHYGSVAGPDLLPHLVRNGRATLMFDGLDEFFAENEDIGATIRERFLDGDSHARLLVVLRDSLLETSPLVRKLFEAFAEQLGPDGFTVYEIARWERQFAQRELAWLKLEKRRPEPGEPDTEQVAGFLALLAGAPRLEALAGIAFYCDLMADVYAQRGSLVEERTGRQMPEDEYDLLEMCFEAIVDRELAKHRPDESQRPEDAFLRADRAAVDTDALARGLTGAASGLSGGLFIDPQAFLRALDLQLATGAGGGDPTLAWGRLGLVQLIEEAAYFARRVPGDPRIVPASLPELYARAGLGTEPEDRLLGERILRQFVLFAQSDRSGTLDFTHEFMADFLAARHIVRLVRDHGFAASAAAGTPVAGETEIFAGYLDRELGGRARG
jgi:hypothetical protein